MASESSRCSRQSPNPCDLAPSALGTWATRSPIDVGAGYRVYFTRRQRVIVILLCGGAKSTQSKDIAIARNIVQEIE